MLSSHLSRYITLKASKRTVSTITWIVRTLLGLVFVFSGFVKAVDPWGTLYKFDEYLAAMGISLWPSLTVTAAFMLCAVEFLVGVFLLFGCFRRTSAIISLLIMAVMLPLTLWIAIADPVADCGCFGDAIKLSNWGTFWKNILLTAASIWMVTFSHKCGSPITPALQWIAFVASAGFIIVIESIGYIYQPLLDFRPYNVGTSIVAEEENEAVPDMMFIYEKNGVRHEFKEDELPDEDEGWIFIDRKEIGDASYSNGKLKGFHIWDGDEDVSYDALKTKGGQLILLMPELKDVSIATIWKINSLYEWAKRHGIDMIAAVAGNNDDIDNWIDLSIPEYAMYTSDDTSIKEVARGNPAIVYTYNGIIKWKSSLRAINVDDFMSPETSDNPMSFARDDKRILLNFLYVYLSVMALLVAASFMPRMKRVFIHGDKVRHEESSSHDTPVQ